MDYDPKMKLDVYVCLISLDMMKLWSTWCKVTSKWWTSRLSSGFWWYDKVYDIIMFRIIMNDSNKLMSYSSLKIKPQTWGTKDAKGGNLCY